MVSSEMQLIAKILKTGDFRTVVKRKITANMFMEPEARAAFRYLWEYYYSPKHPGCIPKRNFFKEKFPAFQASIKPEASMEELCEKVREVALSGEISNLNDEVATLAMSDPFKALEILRNGVTKLQGMTASSSNVLLSDMADALIAEYRLVQEHGGMTGIPFPWPQLNHATGGMHEEDFILLYADHKTMKSFLGIFIGCFVYKEANRRVLYYAAEMNKMLVSRRAATCYCKLDYNKVKGGKLTKGEQALFEGTLTHLAEWERESIRNGKLPSFYIVKDEGGPAGRSGVFQLMAEIDSFEPDVVIVDSFYRMADDYDWKVQASLTKSLKSAAERYKIPVVGITQRNRGKDHSSGDRGMADLSYTLAGAQETDLGFRVVYDGENSDGSVTLHFIIAAAREIKEKGFTIHFTPYRKCEWVGWLQEEDLDEISRKEKERKKKRKSVEEEGAIHRAEHNLEVERQKEQQAVQNTKALMKKMKGH